VDVKRPMCGGIYQNVLDRDDCGMYVQGSIGTENIDMLIDSGANISLLNFETYLKMGGDGYMSLQEYEVPMVTADGTPMMVYGWAKFTFEVGTEANVYKYPLCVADVGVGIILGYDFLKKHKAILNFGDCSLELSPGEVHVGAIKKKEVEKNCEIMIGRTITIPAGGEAMAQGICVKPAGGFIGMIEPDSAFQQKHGILIARSVVSVGEKGIPVHLFNAGNQPATVYKNTRVAECTGVEVVGTVGKEGPVSKELGDRRVPSHVQGMYETGCAELGSNDREQLADLLCEYSNVFSAHGLDMGKTSLIKHKIDTRDAHPIKQRLRRVPLHRKGVVQNEVKKLMEAGLIEPSISPWASSLVLVKKKGLDEDGSIQYRVCIDYRPLNEVTVKDSYPAHKCESCLDSLVGSR